MKNEYDVIIVGSGASGSWAAKELSNQGLEVLLLEAGRAIQPQQDYPDKGGWGNPLSPWPRLKAALQGQHIQARCTNWSEQTKHFFVNDKENPYSVEKGSKFLWFRGRQESGRLPLWGRISPRMSNIDFAAASFDDYGQDWPISYEDLAPYYDRVEEFLGLYGSKSGLSNLPEGKYLAPWPLTSQENLFKTTIENRWPERKVVNARIMRQTSRIPLPLLAAKESGHCDVRSDAVVSKIETDPHTGKASGVCFVDRQSKKSYTVRSRAVVLCASAFESIRLLLNSGSSKHPNGLGNSTGLLGLGIMDNTFIQRRGKVKGFDQLASSDDRYDPSKWVGFFMPQFRNVEKQDADFIRGYSICGGIGRGGGNWWMSCFGSTLPHKTNRVTINKKKKDAYGIPVAHIEYQYQENEWAMIADQKQTTEEMMLEAGLKETEMARNRRERLLIAQLIKRVTFERSVFHPGAAIHECGGASMGSDPSSSILNHVNQCWDVPNVFVTDASCFVTCPAVNLTNSIMAITVRACDNIVEMFKSGDL